MTPSIESLADLGAQAYADGLPCDYDAWAAPLDDSLHWTPCPDRKKEWEHGWYSAAEVALHQRRAQADINAMWRECTTVSAPGPVDRLVGRIRMQPQPVWEEDPEYTPEGNWSGRYRVGVYDGEEVSYRVGVDIHAPPSPMHRPISDDGIVWYWTTNPEYMEECNA